MDSLEIVLSNSKTYEDIQERKTQGFADIEKALEIVREFIVRKKRILYGGMSVDISLRLANHPGVYADDAVPDYDFYSPDIEGDADEIADILFKAGFEGVNAHNAQHATTRRVKINIVNNVADVSYMPKEVYDIIPTQMYKGMRVTHPLFQWMDIHRALSQPFEKPPHEVIAHRVHKDIKRYKLLYEIYGVPYKKEYMNNKDKMESMNIDYNIFKSKSIMLGGYQSYAILHTFLGSMIDEKSLFYKTLDEVGTLSSIKELYNKTANINFKVDKENYVFEFPNKKEIVNACKRIVIISDDFPEISVVIPNNASKNEYYEMFGDYLRPRTIIAHAKDYMYEIFDNLGHIQPGYKLNETFELMHQINPSLPKIPKIIDNLWTTGPQNVVLYALQKYHDYNTPKDEKEFHLYMYQSGIWLIETAEKIVNTLLNSSGIDKKGLIDMYKKMPFFLTTKSYGSENWSADYLSFIYYKTYMVRGIPGNEQIKTRPTYSYNPDRPHTEAKFDVESSFVFQMSGKRVKGPFVKTSAYPENM